MVRFYEPLHVLKRGPLTAVRRFMKIVGSGLKPGKETACNDRYVDHFTRMFEYPGIREISYVKQFMPMAQDGKNHDYVTIYDFESEAAMNAFYQEPVFTGAKQDWEEIGQPAMEL